MTGDFAPRPWTPTAEYYIAEDHDIRDVIEAFGLNYNRGAVVKYMARAGRKPGNDALLDLYKAREHINREIAHLERAAAARPFDAEADARGSYDDAIGAIGEAVKAGAPEPTTGYFAQTACDHTPPPHCPDHPYDTVQLVGGHRRYCLASGCDWQWSNEATRQR